MTLEEALVTLNNQPISKSPYSNAILAILKASLGRRGDIIDKDTLGYVALGKLYSLSNVDKKNNILKKELAVVRSSDFYKQTVVFSAVVLVILAIIVSMVEVLSDNPVSGDYADILKTIITGFFDIVKILLIENNSAPQ